MILWGHNQYIYIYFASQDQSSNKIKIKAWKHQKRRRAIIRDEDQRIWRLNIGYFGHISMLHKIGLLGILVSIWRCHSKEHASYVWHWWNMPRMFDIGGMLRKENIYFHIWGKCLEIALCPWSEVLHRWTSENNAESCTDFCGTMLIIGEQCEISSIADIYWKIAENYGISLSAMNMVSLLLLQCDKISKDKYDILRNNTVYVRTKHIFNYWYRFLRRYLLRWIPPIYINFVIKSIWFWHPIRFLVDQQTLEIGKQCGKSFQWNNVYKKKTFLVQVKSAMYYNVHIIMIYLYKITSKVVLFWIPSTNITCLSINKYDAMQMNSAVTVIQYSNSYIVRTKEMLFF